MSYSPLFDIDGLGAAAHRHLEAEPPSLLLLLRLFARLRVAAGGVRV